MPLKRHGVGRQRIASRVHPTVRQKFSVLPPANGILKSVAQIEKPNDTKEKATKSLQVVAGNKSANSSDQKPYHGIYLSKRSIFSI